MKLHIKDRNKSGIYCIRNLVNNKIYIGKAKDIYNRIANHNYAIKIQDITRINPYLLNSYIKYGKDNFEYIVVEYLPLDENLLSERELYWIEKFEATNKEKGYNLRLDSSTGMITHKSTSEKISKRLKQEWKDGKRSNHGKKLSENWKTNELRVKKQSKLLSSIKTKYKYFVEKYEVIVVDYKGLKELGLKNCQSEFYRKKSDIIRWKGYSIVRVLITKDIVQTTLKNVDKMQ
jgi:group I intron endonuclease